MAFNATGTSLAVAGISNVSNAFAGVGSPLVVLPPLLRRYQPPKPEGRLAALSPNGAYDRHVQSSESPNGGPIDPVSVASEQRVGPAAPPIGASFDGRAGLLDTRGRALRDLRISVTDRCNFRCTYCMPAEVFGRDYAFLPHSEVLTYEEIRRLAVIAVGLGVGKLRITGGEPLVRRACRTSSRCWRTSGRPTAKRST